MISTTTVSALQTAFFEDTSFLVLAALAVLLGALAALMGLGYGIRRAKRWITGRAA